MSFIEDQLPFEDEREPVTFRAIRTRIRPPMPTFEGRPRSTGPRGPFRPPTRQEDPDIWAVHDELKAKDPDGLRTAWAIREALDQIYDGQRTGRWDYSQLMKTEKTHVGTLIEIWLQREFGFDDGEKFDYKIAGIDVDCKWSLNLYGWEIPEEMYHSGPQIALVVWANDYTARWASGLIRITEDVLRPLGRQRDRKRRLNERGCNRILWVHPGRDLPKNILLNLDREKLDRIIYARTGQQAVNNLFREVTGEIINRATVVTVGQQIDSQKRVRDARKHLQADGIVIFGHYAPHPQMAADLGLPKPTLGAYVSARLSPWQPGDPEPWTEIQGKRWRRARPSDPVVPAPVLPVQSRERD